MFYDSQRDPFDTLWEVAQDFRQWEAELMADPVIAELLINLDLGGM